MTNRAELADLVEGQVVGGVDLSRDEAAALSATRLVTVEPAIAGWRVTAAFVVGALTCGELTVRVHPKVGELQVLRLLARAYGLSKFHLDPTLVEAAVDPDLNSVLAALFTREATAALAAGPLRGYRSEDHSLNVLRGRLRIRDQELRRFGELVPLEVTFDEWTTDTDENRRIRAAARRLLRVAGLPLPVQNKLNRVDQLLSDVLVTATPLPWTPTRLNTRLHRLLHLADLVLALQTVEHRVGEVTVHGYTLSMPTLFENLLTRLMRERADGVTVQAQRQFDLDTGRRLVIRPDLVFTDSTGVVGVADVKYKLLDESGRFPNADSYQLLAYCARLGLSDGHLIYAKGDPRPEPYDIVGPGTLLLIHSVDLAGPVDEIERQVDAVRERIIATRSTAIVAGHSCPHPG